MGYAAEDYDENAMDYGVVCGGTKNEAQIHGILMFSFHMEEYYDYDDGGGAIGTQRIVVAVARQERVLPAFTLFIFSQRLTQTKQKGSPNLNPWYAGDGDTI